MTAEFDFLNANMNARTPVEAELNTKLNGRFRLNAELNAERDFLNAELNARTPVEAELNAELNVSFRLNAELNAERHFSLNDSYSEHTHIVLI